MEVPLPTPPSWLSRLWGLLQAIGWTGGMLALLALALATNAVLWAVQVAPESNVGYWLRRQLRVSPALERRSPEQIPAQQGSGAAELRDSLATLAAGELSALNREWLRAYLGNFARAEMESPAVLLQGDFVIALARVLGGGEFQPGGLALLAQSVEAPEVFAEILLPAPLGGTWPEGLWQDLRGRPLTLQGAAEDRANVVIRATKSRDAVWLLTVVPAHVGVLDGLSGAGAPLPLGPVRGVQPARLPVLELELRDFLAPRENILGLAPPYRENTLPVQLLPPGQRAEAPVRRESELPRLSALLDAPATPSPETGPEAEPESGPESAPTPAPAAPPRSPAAERRLAEQIQREMASWELEPWPLFAPGVMPRGRPLTLADAVKLRDYPLAGDPYYIVGEFTVTAAGPSRCVLRLPDQAGPARFAARKGEPALPVRLIVDFPPGIRPPPAGTRLYRSLAEPLQLVRVEASVDKQVNIYLREIIAPPAALPPDSVAAQ